MKKKKDYLRPLKDLIAVIISGSAFMIALSIPASLDILIEERGWSGEDVILFVLFLTALSIVSMTYVLRGESKEVSE